MKHDEFAYNTFLYASCCVQAASIPGVTIYAGSKIWNYDIIVTQASCLSKRDINIDDLQEELMVVKASLQMHQAHQRKVKSLAAHKKAKAQREAMS